MSYRSLLPLLEQNQSGIQSSFVAWFVARVFVAFGASSSSNSPLLCSHKNKEEGQLQAMLTVNRFVGLVTLFVLYYGTTTGITKFDNHDRGRDDDDIIPLLTRYVVWQTQGIHRGTHWLEDFPVGFKLNEPLTQTLGNTIRTTVSWHEYTIRHLMSSWKVSATAQQCGWTVLTLITLTTGAIGLLGLAMDMMRVVHLPILLVSGGFGYAFSLEVFLLSVLSRIFRGTKRNILRQRTDSMQYDSIQLLVASILFAVTLFLFTTILVYRIFFGIWCMAVHHLVLKVLQRLMVFGLYTPQHGAMGSKNV